MKRGFTLIELLVVIAIIGVLSSIVISSLNQAKNKANDVRRKMDLKQIQTALELYYSSCNTYVVAQNCTGTGYGAGSGNGWFSYDYGAGTAGSVAKGLVDNGTIGAQIVDPSGVTAGDTAYMIIPDQNHYTVWATLSNPSALDTATLNTCYFSGYDNYSGAGTQNYCVSN
jgi:prepilin-type N-terminal cleavage/methylation domain-containing protein